MDTFFAGKTIVNEIEKLEKSFRLLKKDILKNAQDNTSPLHYKLGTLFLKKISRKDVERITGDILKKHIIDSGMDINLYGTQVNNLIKDMRYEIQSIQKKFSLSEYKDYILNNDKLKNELVLISYEEYNKGRGYPKTVKFVSDTVQSLGVVPTKSELLAICNKIMHELDKLLNDTFTINRIKIDTQIEKKFSKSFADLLKQDGELRKTVFETYFIRESMLIEGILFYFKEKGLNFSENDIRDLISNNTNEIILNEESLKHEKTREHNIINHKKRLEATLGIKIKSLDEVRKIKKNLRNTSTYVDKGRSLDETRRTLPKGAHLRSPTDCLNRKVSFSKDTDGEERLKGEIPYHLRHRERTMEI